MERNKSDIYGFYGGVSSENQYIPPPSPEFIPHPKSVSFTVEYKNILQQFVSGENVSVEEFLKSNQGKILFRKIVSENAGSFRFEIADQNYPNDIIFYEALSGTTVNLPQLDGGEI